MRNSDSHILEYPIEPYYSQKISKAWNMFWTGFVIYTIFYALMISGAAPAKVVYLQLLGVIVFMISTLQLIKFRIKNQYLRNLYVLYMAWQFFIVVRGFMFNKEYLFNTLIDSSSGIFLYLAPLIILFPLNLIYLRKIINAICVLALFYIIFDIIFIKVLLAADSETGKSLIEYFSKFLEISSGFVLLTIIYHTEKKNYSALIVKLGIICIVVITFFFALVRARRGLMFISVNMLLSAYLLYIYTHKRNLFFRFFPVFMIFFLAIYALKVTTEKNPGMLQLITERVNEDTRSEVEEYFYLDLNQQDWLIGKGIAGQFYCPTGATEDGYRTGIETDYLTLILKGGIVNLGLLLLIAIPAMVKGIFYSKNIISKACGTWILLWLMDLYPSTVTTFSLNYLLVWLSISVCYSKEIRNMSENVVKKYFHYKILPY